MLSGWLSSLSSSWGRLFLAGVVILLVIAIVVVLHDPFDFDDRPHIERLLKLALSNVQSDTAVDMEERTWAQVKLGEAGDFSNSSEREWGKTASLFLAHNPGYLGLLALDKEYRKRRTLELPEAVGLTATIDFLSDANLQQVLRTAATSSNRVAVAPRLQSNGRLMYLIAVPNFVNGENAGFLVAISDIQKTLDSVLSEFKGLGFSVAVLDGSGQLYASGGPEHRREWGQVAEVPLTAFAWQVEVWPKPEMLADTQSPFLELVAVFTTLLILLLASTIHFGRMLKAKSVALQNTHDDLERRVDERTAELRQTNTSLRNLSRHVLHLQDEERRRIARELHDSTAQALSGLKINISTILNQTAFDPRVSRPLLQQSSEMAEQALNEIRTMSYLLHPPILEDFGLESALSWYAEGFSERSGIRTLVKIDPDLRRFSSDLELILFRVVQEALGNIHRHSGSSIAELTLSRTLTDVQLLVRDEGCGLPEQVANPKRGTVPRFGVGIAGMRERVRQFGGTLELVSSCSGTTLTVVLPIHERQKDVAREEKYYEDSV
jgi:signal transduction histidine kinase